MSRVSLSLLKKHVRADDFAADDEYLQHVLRAAEQQVEGLLGYSREELDSIDDEAWPDALRHAVLLRAGTMYAYREDVDSGTLGALPIGLMSLIKPYQRLHGGGLLEALINTTSDESGANG